MQSNVQASVWGLMCTLRLQKPGLGIENARGKELDKHKKD